MGPLFPKCHHNFHSFSGISIQRVDTYASWLIRVRNRRELNAQLKGATLGDAEGDVDNTLKWIKRSKKKEKELAKKRQEEIDNRDKASELEYSERMFSH